MQSDYATLLGLVSQYSPSGAERPAVEWLVARMQSLGFDRAFIDDAGNAVGMLGDGPRQVILLGHIDTVPGEIAVRVEDGQLYGRGSVDAKAPLACFTDAVAHTGALPGWQFVVIGAVEEERDSQGARFVAPRYQPDFAIIGEPNRWDRVSLGYKGSAWADLTVREDQFH
jgi:LysW-gamma-L-lysine carboxypeptidase